MSINFVPRKITEQHIYILAHIPRHIKDTKVT